MLVHVLEFREKLRTFYSKYDRYCRMTARFVFAFAGLWLLSAIGDSWAIGSGLSLVLAAVLALVCTFLPSGVISAVFAAALLLQLFSLSLEAFLVAAVLFLLMVLLYFSFRPHYSVWMAIAFMLYLIHVPQAAYLWIGLFCAPYALIPACFGVMIGYYVEFLTDHISIFAQSSGSSVSAAALIQVLDGVFGSQELYFQLAAVIVSVLTVYILRKRSFRYARCIAAIAGGLVYLLVRLAGLLLLRQASLVWGEVVMTLVSALLVAVIAVFVYVEDYSRVEYAQFEDDEYYYYVKAVPKMTVAVSQTKVKKISAQARTDETDETKNFTPVK